MPDFVGRPLAEASSAIEQAGLHLGEVSSVEMTSAAHSTILRQSPLPGQRVTAETVVTFDVAR